MSSHQIIIEPPHQKGEANLMNPKEPKGFPNGRCGARKRNGTLCQSRPMANGKCRLHGGLTPCGINSPHYKDGKYSKYLPSHLKSDYEAAVSDPELLSLRDDVALYESMQKEQVRRMEQVKFPPWGEVSVMLSEVEELLREGDDGAKERGLAALRELVGRGTDAARAYEGAQRQWRQLSDEKAKTARVEFSRLEALNGVLPVTEVMGVIVGLLTFIREEVKDPASRQRIQNHWNRLVGARVEQQRKVVPLAIEQEVKTN